MLSILNAKANLLTVPCSTPSEVSKKGRDWSKFIDSLDWEKARSKSKPTIGLFKSLLQKVVPVK